MIEKHRVANGILWASSIIASAILGAPDFLTLIILPCLGAAAVVAPPPRDC